MRTYPIYQSLHRHDFVMGGERELVLCATLFCVMVGFGGMTLVACTVALATWLLAISVLRRMAKADPMMSKIWLRHLRQQDFYPARSTPWVRDVEKKK